ncbi:alanine racemase [Microbacterium sp. NPDC055910]|uniref:alanine racemase n=1 Tax=Microbacterium sp. NPDC055910 TaxID=3345659 RepID=UPI0035D5890D
MSGAVLRVDLARIRANLDTLRARVAPADVMFVVKDDAYGHGVDAVVRTATAAGIDWFGSFSIATGVRVRAAAPTARIFAWATSPAAEVDEAIDARLELGVGDAGYLDLVATRAAGRGIRVHLKIDTGLHRNGVRPEDWPAFVARAAALEAAGDIVVTGIWSHIAEASDADDDRARAEFERAVDLARAAGLTPGVRHLAASAAGHARPEFRNDLVRFGAFGYGVRSADGPALPGIVPAAALVAPVVRLDGDTVVVGLGALDGLPSTLGGRVSVGTPAGARALRRVDLAESAVEAWPDAQVGDEVTFFGPGAHGESDPTTLGEAIDTVGEEVLVRVSPLVPREYSG